MDLSHLVSSGRLLYVAPLLPDHISHPADVNPSITSNMTVMRQHVPSDRSRVRLWVKYSLFGFNVVLWVIGAALVSVGIWSIVQKATVNVYKVAIIPFDPAVAFLVVGTVVFIIGFSGCIGALRENITLLSVYVAIIVLIFVAEIILLILVLVYKNLMHNTVKENLKSMIIHYRDDADLQSVIDWVQDLVQCCGIDGPEDWDANLYFNCSSPSREACGVPFSCCITQEMESLKNLQCGYDTRKQSESKMTIYNTGCLDKIQSWMGANQIPLMIAITSILAVQISTASLGLLLYKDIQALLQRRQLPQYEI